MALTKTLQGLLERAGRKGSAIKRVREGQVMGNGYYGYKGDLISQWEVHVQPLGNIRERIVVKHYGTCIAEIHHNKENGASMLQYYYGESNSDRDALNGLCEHYGIHMRFRYKPSTWEFIAIDTSDDIAQIQTDMARAAREKIHEEAPWILGGVN